MTAVASEKIRIGFISSKWAQGAQIPCRYERETGSTNDLAKDEAFDAAAEDAFKFYVADHQTAGRGRGQRTWTNVDTGSALLSSWSFALQDPPQPTLTPRLGLALARATAATWPFLPLSLKAPNDLYVGDGKIAGLLVETLSQGADVRLIVGLGFNVLAAPEGPGINAVHLTSQLPPTAPLLGEDWIAFLERWMFELTEAVGRADQPLSTTERAALVNFMSGRPASAVDDVLADGGLVIDGQTKPWMEI